MIPQPCTFYGNSIDQALAKYQDQMPTILETFEKEYGPGVVQLNNVLPCECGYCVIATVWQDKAKLQALEASKKIVDGGNGLFSELSTKIKDIFSSQECDHDWVQNEDPNGPQIICKKCKTPLA